MKSKKRSTAKIARILYRKYMDRSFEYYSFPFAFTRSDIQTAACVYNLKDDLLKEIFEKLSELGLTIREWGNSMYLASEVEFDFYHWDDDQYCE